MCTNSSVNNLEEIPFVISVRGTVTGANWLFSSLTGYTLEEVEHCKIENLLINLLRVNIDLREKILSSCVETCFIFSKDLEPVETTIHSYHGITDDEMIYCFIKKENLSVKNNFLFIEKFAESNELALAIYSVPDLILLKANEGYLNLLNTPYNKKENVIGMKVSDFAREWDKASIFWHNIVKEGKEFSLKEEKHGERYWDTTWTPIFIDGVLKYFIVNIAECTDRVLNRNHEALIEEHKNQLLKAEMDKAEALEKVLKMKEEFFYTISHEFKTPLTVINAAVQLIETVYKNEVSEKVRNYIKKIRQNSNRQIRLVNNLLDITRLDSGSIKLNKRNIDIVYLTKLITESVELYARQKGVTITFHSDIKLKNIAIDEEKYERILLNLLSNAIKFTPTGKAIDIRVYENEGYIYIEVKDQGVGIPKDKQGIIFDRFGQVNNSLTRQAEGSGIGLSLVKLLVNEFQGKIILDSDEGCGSTFTLMLPCVTIEERTTEKAFIDSTENRIVEQINIEFSDIYMQ